MDWRAFAKQLILADGKIDGVETDLIRGGILDDGELDPDEVAFLLELRREAEEVHPEFLRFLQRVIKRAILKQGTITAPDVAWLRKLIFEERLTDAEDVVFLKGIAREAQSVSPEFVTLLEECEKAELGPLGE